MAQKKDILLSELIEDQKKDAQSMYLYPPKDKRERNLPVDVIDKILSRK